MWKDELADALPDWRLEVVGDGPDRARYEASLAGVPRVVFHGFQDPAPFYAKAKILVLTSDFEGFGLVLVEAMSAGCVPVVLDSFAAVHDIIDGANGNGVLVPAPFDERRFAASLAALMRDAPRLASLSAAARKTSRNFSVASIVDKWETLLAGL
jgi:glycosyltransferase involved in cell wall biosynthesis